MFAAIGNLNAGKVSLEAKMHSAVTVPLYLLDRYLNHIAWDDLDEQLQSSLSTERPLLDCIGKVRVFYRCQKPAQTEPPHAVSMVVRVDYIGCGDECRSWMVDQIDITHVKMEVFSLPLQWMPVSIKPGRVQSPGSQKCTIVIRKRTYSAQVLRYLQSRRTCHTLMLGTLEPLQFMTCVCVCVCACMCLYVYLHECSGYRVPQHHCSPPRR